MTQEPKCDFCSVGDPVWRYKCQSFSLPLPFGAKVQAFSVEDWAACIVCHRFIQTQAWQALAERSARTHPLVLNGQIRYGAAKKAVMDIHERFRSHWLKDEPVTRITH